MRIQDNLMEEEILGGEYREVVLDKKPDFRYYNILLANQVKKENCNPNMKHK